MAGRWKAWKSENSFSTSSHRPLEISQKRRDSHIPTTFSGGLELRFQTARQDDDEDDARRWQRTTPTPAE